MADTYVDISASTNGTGTFASPYNTFTEVNAFTGALGGDVIYVKSIDIARAEIDITSASGFAIRAYGDDIPIISGSDIVSASWLLGANGFYYLSSATNNGLWVNGQRVIDVATEGELAGVTSWFDSGNSRLYISFNPSGSQFEITTRLTCITLSACSDYIVRDLILELADDSCMLAESGADDARFYNLITRNAGGWRSDTGRNGLLIKGASGNIATGVAVKNCTSYGNQNCGAELHYLNGAEINENYLYDNSNGFELWQGMDSNEFRRNKITGSKQIGTSTGHQNGFWSAGDNQSGTGNNPSNTFAYNIMSGTEGSGIDIDDGTGQLIYNNTIYGCSANGTSDALMIQQTGTIQSGATVKNNIIVMTGGALDIVQVGNGGGDLTTKSNVIFADNQYYHEDSGRLDFQIDGTVQSGVDSEARMANFNANLPTPDATSTYGDPLFVDTVDFELDTGSPAINTGSDVSEKIDYRKYPIHGLPDKGAMEKKIMTDTTTSMNTEL